MFRIDIAKDELKRAADMALKFCAKSSGSYKDKLRITTGDGCVKLSSFYVPSYEGKIFSATEVEAQAFVYGEGEIVLSKQNLQVLYTFDEAMTIYEDDNKDIIAEYREKLISIHTDSDSFFEDRVAQKLSETDFENYTQKDLVFNMKYSEFVEALKRVEPFLANPTEYITDNMGLTFFNINIDDSLIEGCNSFSVAWGKINPTNIARQKNLLLDHNFMSLVSKYKPDNPDSEIRFYQTESKDSNIFVAETDGFTYYQSDSNDKRRYINASQYRKYTYEYEFKTNAGVLSGIVKEITKASRKDKNPSVYIKEFSGRLYTLYDGDGYVLINKLNPKTIKVPEGYIKCLDVKLFNSMLSFFSGHDDITIRAQDGELSPISAGDTNDGVMILPKRIIDGMGEKVNKEVEKFA